MRVHIYADASLACGWTAFGAVVRQPDTKGAPCLEYSGMLKYGGCNSSTAELLAAKAALEQAIEHDLLAAGDKVTIISDSDWAVQWINHDAQTNRKAHKHVDRNRLDAIATAIYGLATAAGIELFGHWIKGHQPVGSSVHADHNRKCNNMARRLVRDACRESAKTTVEDPEKIAKEEAWAAELRRRDLVNDRKKAAYREAKAAKSRAKCGPSTGKRYIAFWERPDWSGGDHREDGNPFWMLPPLPRSSRGRPEG